MVQQLVAPTTAFRLSISSNQLTSHQLNRSSQLDFAGM